MKVLVTDGDNRAALAVTRSLGRRGYDIVVGSTRAGALAHSSRYCGHRATYPDALRDPEAFIDRLVDICDQAAVNVVVPISDVSTMLVAQHRHRFSCRVSCPPSGVVERAADKVDIIRTAERIGVPVPRYVVIAGPSEASAASAIGFPLVVKPWRSRIRTRDGWAATSVSHAASADELERDLKDRPAYEFPVMLQERVVGHGTGVFACYRDGRPLALFSHRRLRERPPWGGVSVLSESVRVDAAIGEQATRLLEEIRWDGVAMVEFKMDDRDRVAKLMEINGRFWGSLQLAIDSGVDFPAMLVASTSEAASMAAPYATGIRERWLWGDVDSLLATLLGRHAQTSGLTLAARARALAEFVAEFARRPRYDNPKWYDPWPFIPETASWVRSVTQQLRRGQGAEVAQDPRPVVEGGAPASSVAVNLPIASTPFEMKVFSSFESLPADERTWNALAAQSDTNTIFQTYQWARAWWDTYGGGRELRLCVGMAGDVVRTIAPLVIVRGPSRERLSRFLGDGRADYCDLLAPSGHPKLVESLLNAILLEDSWDRLELGNIPDSSQTAHAIRRCCKEQSVSVLPSEQIVCPTLLIDGHEREALAVLLKPSLRRRLRFFEREGRLVVRHLSSPEEIEPHLNAFFDQHVARWQGSGNHSLFESVEHRGFYVELTRRFRQSPWLLFSIVEFNGAPIAYHYGFDYAGTVTWYKPSFDPAYAPQSPGLTLLHQLIAHSIANKRRELDFTVGDEVFKRRFANSKRSCTRYEIFRNPVSYGLERAGRSLRSAVKSMAGR